MYFQSWSHANCANALRDETEAVSGVSLRLNVGDRHEEADKRANVVDSVMLPFGL